MKGVRIALFWRPEICMVSYYYSNVWTMSMDLKTGRENFVKMGFEEKRSAVTNILEGIKEGDELFTDLYNLIVSDIATEQDFYDVFDSLMIVLYREEKAEEKAALANLGEIKTRLEAVKAKEEEERLQWQHEAESLLVAAF